MIARQQESPVSMFLTVLRAQAQAVSFFNAQTVALAEPPLNQHLCMAVTLDIRGEIGGIPLAVAVVFGRNLRVDFFCKDAP